MGPINFYEQQILHYFLNIDIINFIYTIDTTSKKNRDCQFRPALLKTTNPEKKARKDGITYFFTRKHQSTHTHKKNFQINKINSRYRNGRKESSLETLF